METRDIKGMAVVRRRLIQKKKNNKNTISLRWLYDDLILRTLVVFFTALSFVGIFTDSYGVSLNKYACYGILLLMAAAFTAYYSFNVFGKFRWLISLWLFILPCVLAAFTMDRVRTGCVSIVNDMIVQINTTYSGTIRPLSAESGGKIYVLALVMFYVVWFVAKGVIDSRDNLHLIAVMFPLIVVSAIGGGHVSRFYYIVLLLCFVSTTAMSGVRRRTRFWGGEGSKQYEDNCIVDSRIRKKLLIFCVLLCFAAGMSAYKLYTSVLEKPLALLETRFSPIKTSGLHALGELVPQLSGGRLEFTAEGVGGGVSGGILGEIDGTFFTMQESIKVTCSALPGETLYLKGFVGTTYTGNSWQERDESDFSREIRSWHIDGNNSLYLQNLPFLRMAYVIQEKAEELYGDSGAVLDDGRVISEPEYMTVEHMNEDTINYTYVPYQAYINDYYTILGGDCSIRGQTTYEDSFAWFETSDFKAVMEKYHDNVQEQGTLDKLASLYESYVSVQDTITGDFDFGEISVLCEEKKQEWDAKFSAGMTSVQTDDLMEEKYDDVINFVRRTLLDRCEFVDEAQKLPKGEDYIDYFLNESRRGDSTAFASAAVMMFRMCGIPARYVEGYVAPTNIFSEDVSGLYYAVLQDDNAHTWAEIYVPYAGWTPVEVTPGFDGMISNLEMPKGEDDKDDAGDSDDSDLDDKGDESDGQASVDKIIRTALYFFVIFAVIILLLWIRYIIVHRYRRGILLRMSSQDRVKRLFCSFYDVILFDGFDADIDTTGNEFGCRLSERYERLDKKDIMQYIAIVLNTCYGREKTTDEQADFSRLMYEKIVGITREKTGFVRRLVFRVWKAY